MLMFSDKGLISDECETGIVIQISAPLFYANCVYEETKNASLF